MSRRPLQVPIEQLAKAQSRMAPGGLLWSESPFPAGTPRGCGKRGRNPAAAPISHVPGLGAINPYNDGIVRWNGARAAGDQLVMVACGMGGLVAPAGWTTVATGTLPGEGVTYTWRLVRGVSAGGAAFTDEGQFTGFTEGQVVGSGHVFRGGGTLTVVGSPQYTGPGANQAAFVDTSGSTVALPVQAVITVANVGFAIADWEPPATTGNVSVPVDENELFLHQSDPPGNPYPPPQYVACGETALCSFVAVSYGFA